MPTRPVVTCAVFACFALATVTQATEDGPEPPAPRTADAVKPAVGSDGPQPQQPVTPDTIADNLADRLTSVSPNSKFTRHVIGKDGAGSAAGASTLIYSAPLGEAIFGPPANVRIADDIITIGASKCTLDKFTFQVSGNVRQNGSPDVPFTEPFQVEYALYSVCPGSSFTSTPIMDLSETIEMSGTFDSTGVPDPGGNQNFTVVVEIPPAVTFRIPPQLYLAVTFSREYAGIVIGGPAQVGFSADGFDFPSFPCASSFGGYPRVPHATFNVEVFVRGDCAASYPGYLNSKQIGRPFLTGGGTVFADDIRLSVPGGVCRMVAYEVRVRGQRFNSSGGLWAQMHEALVDSDPLGGGLIEETVQLLFMFGDSVQVVRKDFPEPIRLTGQDYWMVFKTTSGVVGPINTCIPAQIGSTQDSISVHDGVRWESQDIGNACISAFDIAIYCEAPPPIGACCDMVITDNRRCIGGPADGLACLLPLYCKCPDDASDCTDGVCLGDSVCRDVPQMNCPFPTLWKEGVQCESTCVRGINHGQPCTRQADCPGGVCPGEFGPDSNKSCGQSACCTFFDECLDITERECFSLEPVTDPRFYSRGLFCGLNGQKCPVGACLRRDGDCMLERPERGCGNVFCCTDVCRNVDAFCCDIHWDEICVRQAQELSSCFGGPLNDTCFDTRRERGVLLVDANSSTAVSNLNATEDEGDPGFSCHALDPGGQGLGTLWLEFVATHTSARIQTCNSTPPADDSLIAVYRVGDPSTPETTCATLQEIACGDDSPTCAGGAGSDVCAGDLVPGETYYIQLAARTNESRGVYRMDVESPCPTVLSDCPFGEIIWLDPPSGVVDARQPHGVENAAMLQGVDLVVVEGPASAATSCWSMSETTDNLPNHPPYAPELETNAIVGIQSDGSGVFRIKLARPITPGEQTTITYISDSGVHLNGCFVSHPGNADGDDISGTSDIVALINFIKGDSKSPWGDQSEDIDRSGLATPIDILRAIDLLNGAGAFAPGWDGVAQPVTGKQCP